MMMIEKSAQILKEAALVTILASALQSGESAPNSEQNSAESALPSEVTPKTIYFDPTIVTNDLPVVRIEHFIVNKEYLEHADFTALSSPKTLTVLNPMANTQARQEWQNFINHWESTFSLNAQTSSSGEFVLNLMRMYISLSDAAHPQIIDSTPDLAQQTRFFTMQLESKLREFNPRLLHYPLISVLVESALRTRPNHCLDSSATSNEIGSLSSLRFVSSQSAHRALSALSPLMLPVFAHSNLIDLDQIQAQKILIPLLMEGLREAAYEQ